MNVMRIPFLTLSLLFALWQGSGAEADSNLHFKASSTNGEFTFDTGVLRGKLRAGGKSLGLSSVVHLPSGLVLDRSMGLLSHYRLFTKGKRYGGGVWDIPSEAKLRADGAVEMVLKSVSERPFELRAIYKWHNPTTLDLETIVKADTKLPGFEVFVANYFAPQFTNALVWTKGGSGAKFTAAERKLGEWQMFVGDESFTALIEDGRWTFPPYPVEWKICGKLAEPLALRRAPELKIDCMLMAPRGECFAISMPYQEESHYSTYFSLFGRDLDSGEIARARIRLTLPSELSETEIKQIYRGYLEDMKK